MKGKLEKEKKVAVMTIRMTLGTKQAIEREAERHDWSPSKMAEKILSAWVVQQARQSEETIEKGTNVGFYKNEIGIVHISNEAAALSKD